MFNDKSWTEGKQVFNFAACGGSRMAAVESQLQDHGGKPRVIWAMFGGNDAGFGAIARACIYQPVDPGHLGGWGPAWDEDPGGSGQCKINIASFDSAMNGEIQKGTKRTIDDILNIAQGQRLAMPTFDLYLSGYVDFFNTETDDCDKWSFAHDRLSVGHPKLVKGLRQVISDMVNRFNNMQAEIIRGYQPPLPADPHYRVHHELPSPVYDGHRFCEPGHTFEDQFYGPSVWLWNLQYYDEQGDNVNRHWMVKTDASGTKFMSSDPVTDPTLPPILASDDLLGQDIGAQQYGFGWTARPFHPKWDGHTALKDAFIRRMRSDGIVVVRASASEPAPDPAPSPAPVPVETNQCHGLGDDRYVDRDLAKDAIDSQFCPEAATKGSISREYYERTPDHIVITVQGPAGFKPTVDDCVKYLLGNVIDGCDGNDPNNPANFKGGGTMTTGDVKYDVQPKTLRQPPKGGIQGGCDSTYKVFWNEYVMWGRGWATHDGGVSLNSQVDDCALLPRTWSFQYGLGSDGREWTAKFRTGVFQRHCVGSAGKEAGAPSNFKCGGSG